MALPSARWMLRYRSRNGLVFTPTAFLTRLAVLRSPAKFEVRSVANECTVGASQPASLSVIE